MKYRLILKPVAQKDIARLSRSLQKRIVDHLAEIERNPRMPGSVKLTGTKATYRVRVGNWRIVYEIDDVGQTVLVTIVAHRRDVYRR